MKVLGMDAAKVSIVAAMRGMMLRYWGASMGKLAHDTGRAMTCIATFIAAKGVD
jgi:hypothetical protein